MKKLLFPFVLLLFAVAVQAQIQDPVKFNSELKILAADEAEVVFTAAIDKGWHVYSTDLDDGGPISATFNVEKISGAEVVGKLKPVGKEISTFDKLFEMKVRYFENTAQFVQKLKLTGGAYQLEGYLEYGACNDENCLPPTQVPFQFSGKAEGAAKETTAATAETKAEDAVRQSRRLSPARLPWLPSAVRTGRRKSMWRTRRTSGSQSSVNCNLWAKPLRRKTCPGFISSLRDLPADCWHSSPPVYGPSSR